MAHDEGRIEFTVVKFLGNSYIKALIWTVILGFPYLIVLNITGDVSKLPYDPNRFWLISYFLYALMAMANIWLNRVLNETRMNLLIRVPKENHDKLMNIIRYCFKNPLEKVFIILSLAAGLFITSPYFYEIFGLRHPLVAAGASQITIIIFIFPQGLLYLFMFMLIYYALVTLIFLIVFSILIARKKIKILISIYHPDERGGLKFLADTAFRMAVSLFIILLWLANTTYYGYIIRTGEEALLWLQYRLMTIIAVSIGIFILFFVPLLAFREIVTSTKLEELNRIQHILEEMYFKIRGITDIKEISDMPERMVFQIFIIDRLYESIKRIREYPFDTAILAKLFTIGVAPILSIVLRVYLGIPI